MMHVNVAMIGLGSVNRNLLQIISDKADRIEKDFGLTFRIRLIVDSRGCAYDEDGFSPLDVIACKETGKSTADFEGFEAGYDIESLLASGKIDLVFEASPVELVDTNPGLMMTRNALEQGVSAVLANKAPVVMAFEELHTIASRSGAGLKYSATVCGGLPILNIGQRDMIAGDILSFSGVFNATSNFILDEMARGTAYEDALAEAQERGIAEANPSLDVDGWDTANKLLIIANTLMDARLSIDDISVTGISTITPSQIAAEADKGHCFKLIATAENDNFSVAPISVPKSSFLGQCIGWEMGVEIHTDIYGISYHKLWEREPIPTAASMLRDAIHICEGWSRKAD